MLAYYMIFCGFYISFSFKLYFDALTLFLQQ